MLLVFYEGNRVDIEIDLRMCQMLVLYRDAKLSSGKMGLKCLNMLGLYLVLPQLVVEGS